MSLVKALKPKVIFPHWLADLPEKTSPNKKISGDWATVRLYTDSTRRKVPRIYTLELSTGDLYGLNDPSPQKPYWISMKCAAMVLGLTLYTPAIMLKHLVQIAKTIISIFTKVLPQLIADLSVKPLIASFANAGMRLIYEIPLKLSEIVKKCVRSPFFAIAMVFAATFGVIYPQEGRKWLGKIELDWHENVTYKDDIRFLMTDEEWEKTGYNSLVGSVIFGESTLFLGYCMQKRGNINDTISGKPRFTYIKVEEKDEHTTPNH